jgi:hypothetical protein
MIVSNNIIIVVYLLLNFLKSGEILIAWRWIQFNKFIAKVVKFS